MVGQAAATPRPRPKPVNPLTKALKHHPDAPTDEDYNFHYGKRKEWARKVKELEAQRSPVALAAAGEGSRRQSLTPSHPPTNISGAEATRVSANVVLHPQPSQKPTRQLNAEATTTTISRVSVPKPTPNVSGVDATPRASANAVLRSQPNAISQNPEDPMKRLCDPSFVRFLLERYEFDKAQRQALWRYIKRMGHSVPWTMDRYGLMTAADVIRYMPIVPRTSSEDEEEEAEEEEEEEGPEEEGQGPEEEEHTSVDPP